jgi:hypothetical protein
LSQKGDGLFNPQRKLDVPVERRGGNARNKGNQILVQNKNRIT